jgi:flagellar biosynthetic protein FliS
LIQSAERADAEMTSPEKPGDSSQAAHCVTRCIDIMTELNTCLDHSVDASLCSTLSDLYRFFTQEFSEAFARHEPKRIRSILPLIRELRDAWFQADRKANQMQFAAA